MYKYKACIFDLDGVLVDTARLHFKAWKRLADSLEIPFTERDNERLKGVTREQSLQIILEKATNSYEVSEQEQMAFRKNNWYLEYVDLLTPADVLSGATRLLKHLRQSEIRLALASGSKNARSVVGRLELSQYFDVIIDGNNVTSGKPDPEIFLKSAAAMGVEPQQCIVFEDAHAGIEAALSAGMFAVGVGGEDNLQLAKYLIPSLEMLDLPKLETLLSGEAG